MYQRYNYKRNQHIMNDLQCISVNFQNDQPIECFTKKMKSDIRLTNRLLLFVVIIAALSIPLFTFWTTLFPQDGIKRHAAIEMIPFIDASHVLEYWLKTIFLTLVILYANIKIVAVHCFYIGALSQIKCGFIHLRKNISYAIECTADLSLFYRCIKIHQNIIRVGNNICDTYSPVFSFFLAFFIIENISIMVMIICIPNMPLMMKYLPMTHLLLCLITLYISCNVGSSLEEESTKIGKEPFGIYILNPSILTIKQNLLILLLGSYTPLRCKCIFQPSVCMNNETYARFFKFSFSVLLATKKIVNKGMVD
ncbi:uncharacterized protein LOC126904135 isoform X2 [Daktulosphaira vitifoliae]|nr:uncharacterized protein LOC126904135 isoform X2 [Daktulosphaira vitifoliae]